MTNGPRHTPVERVFLLFFVAVLSILMPIKAVLAATSDTIAFQSKLVNSDGTNVTNNSYNFRFIIYTVSSGGTAQWTEDKTITVADGVVSTALGSSTSFPAALFDNADLYLQVCFDGNGTAGDSSDANCGTGTHRYEEVFTTRKAITAVPLAFRAKYLTDGAGNSFGPNSFFQQNGNAFGGAAVLGTTDAYSLSLQAGGTTGITILTSGNVGIGQPSPGSRLEVTDTSNTVASFTLSNNTATTVGAAGNTLGVVEFQSTSLTTGNLFNIEANALTTGRALNITSTGAGLTSGNLIRVNSGATTTSTGNLVDFSFAQTSGTGAVLGLTSSGVQTAGSILAVVGNSATTTTNGLVNIAGNSLTTGSALKVTSTGTTTLTGNLVDFSSAMTSASGNILALTASGVKTAGSILAVIGNSATTTTNGLVSIAGNALTTGSALKVTSTGTTTLTGNLVDFSSSMTSASGNILGLTASGVKTAGSILAVTGNSATTTTNGLVYISGNALTTGSALKVVSTGTTTLTGNLVDFSSAMTSASGNILGLTASGIKTAGSILSVIGNTATTTTAGLVAITGNGLTTGSAMVIASSSTGLTGDLASITASGSNAGVTGNALKVGLTGASAIGTAVNITTAGSAGLALRVNDDGSYTDTTPFAVDYAGNVGIGTAAPGQKLSVEGTLGILETGSTPTYHTIFQGGDQAADITYTLPTTSSNGVLTNTGGVLSWAAGGGGGVSTVGSMTATTVFADSSANGQWLGLGASAGRIAFVDSTTDYVNIMSANVGIGTATPSNMLTVFGAPTISSITFTGGGLNDMSVSGTYAGQNVVTVRVQIDGSGAPDTFMWSSDNGTNWISTDNDIVAGPITLYGLGIDVTFAATSGHTIGNSWSFTLTPGAGNVDASNGYFVNGTRMINSFGVNNENIAIGVYALSNSQTATQNTMVGGGAGNDITRGSYNVGVGADVMSSITTGNYIVAIGQNAGSLQSNATALVGATRSVYIGAGTRGYNDSDDNSIVIGYNAIGLGANTVVLGNDSIATTALKGSVAIGNTTLNGPKLGITDTSNTLASLQLTNNTATTIGAAANTLGVLDLQSTSLTTGNFMNVEVDALTSGKGINVNSASAAFTGDLANFIASGSNAAVTGNVLKVGMTGAAATGTVLNITTAGASGAAIRINDDGTYADTSPFLIDWTGNVAIGQATTGAKVDIYDVSGAQQALKVSNNSTTAIGAGVDTIGVVDFVSTSLTTGNLLNVQANGLTSGRALNVTSTGAGLTSGNLIRVSSGATTTSTANMVDFTFAQTSGTGAVLGLTSSGAQTAGSILAVTGNSATTTTNGLVNIAGNALTTGSALKVTSTGTTTLTGNLVDFSSSMTSASGNILGLTASGIKTAGSILAVTGNSATTTTNGLVYISGNALTTGSALKVVSTGTTTLTGNLVDFSSSMTSASGNILGLTASGVKTAGSILKVVGDSATTTTGGLVAVSGNGLTTGSAMVITSSSTGLTGDLASITASGSNAGVTGNALKVGLTGASAIGNALNVTTAGSAGMALLVNDDGSYADSTPFSIDFDGKVGVGTTTQAARLQINGSSDIVQFAVRNNGTQTANLFELQNSGGTKLTSFDVNGYLDLTNVNLPSSYNLVLKVNSDTLGASELAGGFGNGIMREGSGRLLVNYITNSAANSLFGGGVSSDAYRRFTMGGDGKWSLGDGTATQDTNLYRSLANVLATDDSFYVGLGLGIKESGGSPTYYTIFQGGDQAGTITYTLPTSSSNGVLTNTGGVLSWAAGGSGSVTVGSMTGSSVFADATATGDWLGLGASAGRIAFDDQATDFVNILDANVGIGTATPTALLHVAGSFTLNDIAKSYGFNASSLQLNSTHTKVSTVGFGSPRGEYSTGTNANASSVAAGDFNNDGYPDFAVTNYTAGTLSIFINNKDGTFAANVDYATGSNPVSVAVGDVNLDGWQDLAVTNFNSVSAYVFINNKVAGGTFTAGVSYTTGTNPYSVVIGDVNNDGWPDMAVANNATANNSVSVFINNKVAGGTFAAKVDYTAGSNPYSVAIGDLNDDGWNDLAVANYGSANVSVFINNKVAGGTFAAASNTTVGTNPESVAIGDLNNDGWKDMAITNYTTNNVSVVMNTKGAGGTFAAAVNYATGTHPYVVKIGDVNNDGLLDLAVANNGSNSVSIFKNNINAPSIFTSKADYSTGWGPWSLEFSDIDKDGYLELAVANYTTSTLSILNNLRDGSFSPEIKYAAGTSPLFVTAGDLNNDGWKDLVVANDQSTSISVYINNKDGTYASQVVYTAGSRPQSIAIGDMNNDGWNDIAVANYAGPSISIYINNKVAAGTFAAQATYAAGTGPDGIVMADLNDDGWNDIATANYGANTISVFINNKVAGGTVAAAVPYNTPASSTPQSIVAGDMNNDGWLDLVTANYGSVNASVFINNKVAGGTFAAAVNYTTGTNPWWVSMGDVNNDGWNDLAVANYGSDTISIFINNKVAGGTVANKVDYPASKNPTSVVIGDIDKDGWNDLVTSSITGSLVSVYTNNRLSTGTFKTPIHYGAGLTPLAAQIADLNNDGFFDLYLINNGAASVATIMNGSYGTEFQGDLAISGQILGVGNSGSIQLATNNTNRMVIASNGNIGIGKTTPNATLDVNGTVKVSGAGTKILTGSIDPTASTTVTGVGTLFTKEVSIGDRIVVSGEHRIVVAIASDTSLTVDTAFSDNANDTSVENLSQTTTLGSGLSVFGGAQFAGLQTPAAPTVAPQGTTGAATWSYRIAAVNPDGNESILSAAGTTTTGNATLTGGNYNRITWTAVNNAASYRIYRTAFGTSPNTAGLIGIVYNIPGVTLQFDDTGIAIQTFNGVSWTGFSNSSFNESSNVSIGTSVLAPKDTLSVDGRINQSWHYFFTDFFGSRANVTANTQNAWEGLGFRIITGCTGSFPTSEPNGAMLLTSGTTANYGCLIDFYDIKQIQAQLNPVLETEVRMAETTLKTVFIGFNDTSGATSAAPVNGVYFTYNPTTSAYWQAVTSLASSRTTITTTVVPTTATYQTLRIELTTTSTKFFINGVMVANIGTTIPAAATYMEYGAGVTTTTTVAKTLYLGSVEIWQDDPAPGTQIVLNNEAVAPQSLGMNAIQFADTTYMSASSNSTTMMDGMLVSYDGVEQFDLNGKNKAVFKVTEATPENKNALLGVFSGLQDVFSVYDGETNAYNVATLGTAYLLVEEGDGTPITIGDSLALSPALPGYGAKATKGTVATAAENVDWDSATEKVGEKRVKKILVYVHNAALESVVDAAAVPLVGDLTTAWTQVGDTTVQTPFNVVTPELTATTVNANVLKTRTLNVNDTFMVDDLGNVSTSGSLFTTALSTPVIKGVGGGVTISLGNEDTFVVKVGDTNAIEASVKGVKVENLQVSNRQAGKVRIESGKTTATVSSSLVTSDSIVVVTPSKPVTTSVQIEDGKFTITIGNSLDQDIEVNWYVMNVGQ